MVPMLPILDELMSRPSLNVSMQLGVSREILRSRRFFVIQRRGWPSAQNAVMSPGATEADEKSDPDLLTPVEVDRLVRVVFWKAIHDDDIAEPAARFCARVITAELDGVFIDWLLWTCCDWFKQHNVLLRRSTAIVQWEPPPQQDAGNQVTALVGFMATLLSSIPGKGTAASVGSCHPGHIFCIAALLCDSCKLVLRSPELDHHTEVCYCHHSHHHHGSP
ncbi:hypothetical protein HPB51_020892 [Rhipicephalus microplus]|uniref:Uncharacterized protein n=1 Tax=Rhipicephalus microplus TaxID=6941 RepID=A0A9J6EPW9_RHIMP|nr:hypothetical protein HPB51_020892 [Rhipicephalus microplus]